MQKYSLKALKRDLLGRKVKKLRNEGLVPANVFGKKIDSKAVTVNAKEFAKIYSEAGGSGLVDLELDGKKLPVLINNVAYHPVTSIPVHVDFHQVDLKEKVTAHVPLEIIGEAPAVKDKIGVLLTTLNEIEVEALPADLPEKITVDVTRLKAIDESIKISELKVDGSVKILNDAALEVVKVAPLVSKEAEKMAEETAAAQAAAAALSAESASGEAEAKKEEAPKSEAKKEETQKS